MKPLYLLCREKTILALDGPSLVVWTRRRIVRRIPLTRVSRIVAGGNALLQTAAVCACLERGISLTYAAEDGPQGWAAPFRIPAQPLALRLERFCDRPGAAELLEIWRSARERAAILAVLRELDLKLKDLRALAVEAHLCGLLKPGEGRRFLFVAHAVLASRLTEHLTAEGCDTTFGAAAGRFGLIGELARLMLWEPFGLWILRSRQGIAGRAREVDEISVAAWMEDRAAEDEERIRQLMDFFLVWLGKQT